MKTRIAILFGLAIVACTPEPDAVPVQERSFQAMQLYLPSSLSLTHCPPVGCGSNSPFIGPDLDLTGVHANAAEVRFREARIPVDPPTVPETYLPLTLDLTGDVLSAWHPGVGAWRTGAALVGMQIVLEGRAGVGIVLTVVDADEAPMWAVSSSPHHVLAQGAPTAPTYRFEYQVFPSVNDVLYGETQGTVVPGLPTLGSEPSGIFDLCPMQSEESGDPLADGASGWTLSHHALTFAGERFDYARIDVAETTPGPSGHWLNWGCLGSASFKMHVSGHSSAADARLGWSTPLSAKQAMLKAITATYCDDAVGSTLPGMPLRYADDKGAIPAQSPFSFRRDSPGTLEALWTDRGALCIGQPRLLSSLDLTERCKELPACEDLFGVTDPAEILRQAFDFDGSAARKPHMVATFNMQPGGCSDYAMCDATQPARNGCWCDDVCNRYGDCCDDYLPACVPCEFDDDGTLPSHCDCPEGYEFDAAAQGCLEEEGCGNDPCYPGVACTDIPAPGTGFECGPCPAPMTGDGQTCIYETQWWEPISEPLPPFEPLPDPNTLPGGLDPCVFGAC